MPRPSLPYLVAVATFAAAAASAPTPPPSSGAASGTAASSAAVSGTAATGTPAPTTSASSTAAPPIPSAPKADTLNWPIAPSRKPSAGEWNKAQALTPTRATGERSKQCQLSRVREWLRIRCAALPIAAITQLAGSPTDTRREIAAEGADGLPGGGTLELRLRQDDPRVFSFWTFGQGYDGPLTVVPAVGVQITWPAASSAPIIVFSDALYEPVPTARSPQ